MSLRLGVVVETHSDDNAVDMVMTDDGARITGAQLMSMGASGRTGTVDLPEIKPKGEKWDITQRDKDQQDVLAIVGQLGRNPIVLGFIFPQVNQMLFKDGKLRFYRHQSDVMTTLDGDGNFQFTHPGGAYIRIGETPDKEDLADKNADKSLKPSRNTGRKVNIRIGLADDKVVFTLTPDGDAKLVMERDLLIEAKGKADIKVTGNVTATIEGTTTVNSTGAVEVNTDASATVKAQSVTLDTPQTTCTGNLTVEGALSYGGGMSGSGSGSVAVFNGPVEFKDNVQVDGNLNANGSITDSDGDGGA